MFASLRVKRGCSLVSMVVALVLFGSAASAQDGDECATWFPDFDNECDRKARFDDFVQPMSMPFIFEDPFITTGANLVGIWNALADNGNWEGGDVGVLALQLRVALTDKLALIATKDGFTMIDYDTKLSDVTGNPADRQALLKDDEGFMNMTVGFKYAMIEDEENEFILSPALRYEIPLGNDEVLQGRGDGIFIPSATFAWGATEDLHLIGGMGGQIPVDSNKESTQIFYNMHAQYVLLDMLVPFIELSGIHWTNSGNGGLKLNTSSSLGTDVSLDTAQAALGMSRFDGADVANLGSKGVRGENLVTMAWGARFPLNEHLVLGLSYEKALHGKKHLFQQRVTAMATFEY
jgi:hypothetical protein